MYLHASRPATAIVVSYLTYLWFSGSLLLLHPQIIWIHLTSTDQINSNRILLLHGRSQGQPHLHLDT